MIYVYYANLLAALCSLMALYVIYRRTYRDPRWRVFDVHSRQATEAEIYNVAEIPVVCSVKLAGPRTLRFEFLPPINAPSWETLALSAGAIHRSQHAEIVCPDSAGHETYRLTPEGRFFSRPIEMTIHFYPEANYQTAGLSWPDNYHVARSTVPFSRVQPYRVQEWAGLIAHDLDVLQARSLLEDRINFTAPTPERIRSVFRVVMEDLAGAGGIPTDALQQASPLDTYDLMQGGKARGWCENVALVYYLLANAAGVSTRLVDMAGKFGPLKLTGHYVCESWVPEQAVWCFVDPQSRVACVAAPEGRLLNTLEIKRLADTGLLSSCRVNSYDEASGDLVERDARPFDEAVGDYLRGDIVLAYKFGYARNRDFSRWHHFIFYPTLLYATFPLPRLYRLKKLLLLVFLLSLAGALASGWWLLIDLPV